RKLKRVTEKASPTSQDESDDWKLSDKIDDCSNNISTSNKPDKKRKLPYLNLEGFKMSFNIISKKKKKKNRTKIDPIVKKKAERVERMKQLSALVRGDIDLNEESKSDKELDSEYEQANGDEELEPAMNAMELFDNEHTNSCKPLTESADVYRGDMSWDVDEILAEICCNSDDDSSDCDDKMSSATDEDSKYEKHFNAASKKKRSRKEMEDYTLPITSPQIKRKLNDGGTYTEQADSNVPLLGLESQTNDSFILSKKGGGGGGGKKQEPAMDIRYTRHKHKHKGKSSNGLFSTLPKEVMLHISWYLTVCETMITLARLNRSCQSIWDTNDYFRPFFFRWNRYVLATFQQHPELGTDYCFGVAPSLISTKQSSDPNANTNSNVNANVNAN
ncbi:hypothetical protein RFI_03711, partial [Reticulomyxa filosa]